MKDITLEEMWKKRLCIQQEQQQPQKEEKLGNILCMYNSNNNQKKTTSSSLEHMLDMYHMCIIFGEAFLWSRKHFFYSERTVTFKYVWIQPSYKQITYIYEAYIHTYISGARAIQNNQLLFLLFTWKREKKINCKYPSMLYSKVSII